ncbi:MAG: glycosyltransferase family 9 protein [Ignavibacteria bacterium]|nr:glycosyltransferase family 9 protein [Ignavibacteria bacterium]
MAELKKVLFLSEGQLGDCLVLTPALRALKEKFPHLHITVLVMYRRNYAYFWNGNRENYPDVACIKPSNFTGTAEVFKDNPYVDSVFEMDRGAIRKLKGLQRIKTEIRNIFTLRAEGFDAVICNFPEDRFSIYAFLSGAKFRIGERPSAFSFLLNRKTDVSQEEKGVLEYFISLLSPLGVENGKKDLFFNVSEEDVKCAGSFLRESGCLESDIIVGIHPGSSQDDRKWLPQMFSLLIDRIRDKCKIVILYSDYDADFVNEIRRNSESEVLTVRTESLKTLAAYIKNCRFCITHSSGPRHLAAAIGVPVIGLFEKRDDIRWGIYDTVKYPVIKTRKGCPVCPADKCLGIIPDGKYGSYCMRNIDSDEVFDKVNEFIEQHGNSFPKQI